MAVSAINPAMNGDKALFPLFAKAQASNGTNPPTTADEHLSEFNGLDGNHDEGRKSNKASSGRKPRKKQVAGQKTLQEIVNPKVVPSALEGDAGNGEEQIGSLEEDPSPRRSKRRRTSQTDSVEVGGQDDRPTSNGSASRRRGSPQVIVPASSPLPAEPMPVTEEKTQTPPKKMLRLKAGGKFSSPVSKKSKEEEPPAEVVKKRGRPRKAKEQEQEKHLVAVLRYDTETEVGLRINRILAGEERFKKQVKIVPKKQSTPRKDATKAAHPFFSLDRRKEQAQPPVQQPSPRKASAVTPGKLRRETLNNESARQVDDVPETWTSSLLKDRLMFKQPGAQDPAWPTKEHAHVRGLTSSDLRDNSTIDLSSTLHLRKRKGAQRSLLQSESLLTRMASRLEAEQDGTIRPDGFCDPHPSLEVPKRSLMCRQEIIQRSSGQVSVLLSDSDEDELSKPVHLQYPMHLALQSTVDKIGNSPSALDAGKGDATSWAQKYAPSSCGEVLQPARQTTVLKDWLVSLRISTVESTSKSDAKSTSKAEPKAKKRKRRRKDDEMDEFLVDSDEEVHDMDELQEAEDLPPAPFQGKKALNSIVQVATEGVKLSNAVLLSGPHGCGKTAAAYAAAKELGFKVFEINSSERRSGKDVLDKVGDMTENHLVKHHGTDSGEQSSTEEPNNRLDEAFQRDLASGRQGKMASFFKPQAVAKAKPKFASPKKTAKAKTLQSVQNVLKKPTKDQQQSLILLEEVDILFKEDKDFWTTIFKLIATSKRPFIMTCNDEDLVPLQAMKLHAILRFSPPPVDLATDHLVLIAAAEGHLLEREAVSSLYRSKDCDLRATISELDLWCQMGIGDPRGGLGWVFQRYPPGSDLDANGRRLHVISEGTYQKGMDSCLTQPSSPEDNLKWAMREHAVDASTALGWESMNGEMLTSHLKDYCRFADDLSASDVYAHALCSPALDITQKPMREKARSHYIEGLPLLQTDEYGEYSGLREDLIATTSLLAFRARDVLLSDNLEVQLERIGDANVGGQLNESLTRHAFTCFDAISVPAESTLSTVSGLQQSAFDGPLAPIATDIAPYVRSIVHFDLALAEQRDALGGGKSSKRARTTRAARSALEGGQRASTRRERWFPRELDFDTVLATGGKEWPKMLALTDAEGSDGCDGGESEAAPASSAESI